MSEAIIMKRKKSSGIGNAYLVTEVIENNTTWVVPAGIIDNVITVRLFGGGGGGHVVNYTDLITSHGGFTNICAGGGGYMNYAELNSKQLGSSVRITIGRGGNPSNSGETTSFGTFLSAAGGSAGNNISGKGGSGGSGGFGVYGGDGYQFGGGGGIIRGGNGGTWGGGGGSGNLNYMVYSYDIYNCRYMNGANKTNINSYIGIYNFNNNPSGGSGGTYGGDGSSSGTGGRGTNVNFEYSFFTNRINIKANGGKGVRNNIKTNTADGNSIDVSGIGGGGGGGYGSIGGNGGKVLKSTGGTSKPTGSDLWIHRSYYMMAFSGGGGGGYGGNGGSYGGGGGFFTMPLHYGGAGYGDYGIGGNCSFEHSIHGGNNVRGSSGVCIIQFYI